MDKPDLLLLIPLGHALEARLADAYTLHRHYKADDKAAHLGEVGGRIRAAVGSGGRGLSKAEMDKLPTLEIVSLFGVGLDTMDVEAARTRGVRVTDTPQVTADVADTALALYLAASRRLLAADAWVREGSWAEQGRMPPPRRASGRRVGVFGMGRIGQAIAARFAPLAETIAYTSRHPASGVAWRHEPDLLKLAQDSDVLVLAVPGGDATHHAVDAPVLDALGKDGIVVNIARGSVINEAALVSALHEERIFAAGLDVFEDEPNVSTALREAPNTVFAPHIGGASRESMVELAQGVLANLQAHFTGEPLPSPVV